MNIIGYSAEEEKQTMVDEEGKGSWESTMALIDVLSIITETAEVDKGTRVEILYYEPTPQNRKAIAWVSNRLKMLGYWVTLIEEKTVTKLRVQWK